MKLSLSEHEKILQINQPSCPEAWTGICLPIPEDIQSLIDKGALEVLGETSFVRASEGGRAYCKDFKESTEALA